MPIHHILINVPESKWDAVVKFYENTLKPLNYKSLVNIMEGTVIGFGEERPDFWIIKKPDGPEPAQEHRLHFAFSAESKLGISSSPFDYK